MLFLFQNVIFFTISHSPTFISVALVQDG